MSNTRSLRFAFLHARRARGCLLLALAMAAGAGAARGAKPGDEVVVVYNQRLPESKAIADHYARCRAVPPDQVFGFALSTNEEISRVTFRTELEQPLAKRFTEQKLWRIALVTLPGTNASGQPLVIRRPVESRIRYLVLCYGVPLKISPDPELKEEGMDQMRPELRRNEAAVDNELACLPLIEAKPRRYGPLMNPFYATTNAAILHPTNGVLLVARLDGPCAAVANGLVDKALEAETNGLWGWAYFDLRSVTDTNYRRGDDLIRGAAEIAQACGFETVVDTNAATFPAAFPLSQVALYAGWYDEHVSGPFARPVVEFMPGAFAYHLHSGSASTLRSTNHQWAGPLLAKGAAATMGCVYEPYLTGTPDMGVFFGRFVAYGWTFGEAAYACTPVLSWQTTVLGDPLYRPFGRNVADQLKELERRHSPLIEWAYLRMADVTLTQPGTLNKVVAYLEGIDATRKSAVLMEKLSSLYAALGKPSSSAWADERALALSPSPQQRVRLMLALAEKYVAAGRDADAFALYEKFLKTVPDYPDLLGTYRRALPVAQRLGKPEAEHYAREIDRLTAPPR